MFGSKVLEVGVGLSLLFLFVSLICTAIREMIEAVMKSRAMDLERGIRTLLNDADGTGHTRQLFDHPLIFSLFGGTYDPGRLRSVDTPVLDQFGVPKVGPGNTPVMKKEITFSSYIPAFDWKDLGKRWPFVGRDLPSYIPSAQFARALLDLVARGPTAKATTVVSTAPLSVASLRATVADIENPKLQRALLSAIDSAQGDLDKVRANLEQWYNGTMDRVAGWYKRRTQKILFFLGLLAAVFLNIDAITIAQRLDREQSLQARTLDYATKLIPQSYGAKVPFTTASTGPMTRVPSTNGADGETGAAPMRADTGSPGTPTLSDRVGTHATASSPDSGARTISALPSPSNDAGSSVAPPANKAADNPGVPSPGAGGNARKGALPTGVDSHAPAGARPSGADNEEPNLDTLSQRTLAELAKGLSDLDYPMGWNGWWPKPQAEWLGCTEAIAAKEAKAAAKDVVVGKEISTSPEKSCSLRDLNFPAALSVALGWVITALAVTLGAPFWFDVLNKFMVVRSTVKPHEKAGRKRQRTPTTRRKRPARPPEALQGVMVEVAPLPRQRTAGILGARCRVLPHWRACSRSRPPYLSSLMSGPTATPTIQNAVLRQV